jgi:hypothetical protein
MSVFMVTFLHNGFFDGRRENKQISSTRDCTGVTQSPMEHTLCMFGDHA